MAPNTPAFVLYHFSASFFSAVARIALAEAGLAWDSRLIDLGRGDNASPDYLRVNPAGTVPTLVLPGGETITESRNMLSYCARRKPSLGGAKAEAFVRRFYDGDLGYMHAGFAAAGDAAREQQLDKWRGRAEAAAAMLAKATDPVLKEKYRERMAVNKAKVADAVKLGPPWGTDKAELIVSEIEGILLADGKDPRRDFICGPEFTIADACAVTTFDVMVLHGYEGRIWGNGKHQAVVDYLARVRERPSYAVGRFAVSKM
ncbi:thioredoxin-like protein [Hyaloraphidium curvatum]|nr:thioredoxin-like protein [Hyaloraphidium curvatum]